MDGDSGVGIACKDPLVARLVAFCDDQTVRRTHERFCRSHADEFFGFSSSHDNEKSHRVHELFTEYERMFEQTLQDFLDMERIPPEDFYTHCRWLHQASRNDQDDDALLNLKIVLSALDFDAFCELMEHEAIETQRALKAAEDMGL